MKAWAYNPVVEARLNFITLAVRDLSAARTFYVDGLGWQPALWVPNEVMFIRLSPTLCLSLWNAAEFETEVGPLSGPDGLAPFALAHNVPHEAEVDAVLADAVRAGGTLFKSAVKREWGGYSGYFRDTEGFVWEVAYNPGPIGEELMAATPAAAGGETTVEVIRSRRSVAQGRLVDGPGLDHAEVVRAVESARWAPNHKRTEPWRFYRLDGARQRRLADLWAEQLERTGSKPERVEAKRTQWASAPGVVVVTCTSSATADEKTRLEDYAATACAVQNFCLHLWAKEIATKWSTAAVEEHEEFWRLLGHDHEPADTRVVAFVFYGLAAELPKAHRRLAAQDVLVDYRA